MRRLLIYVMLFIMCVAGVSATEIQIETKTVKLSDHSTLNITCIPSEPVKAWEFKVSFNQSIIHITNVTVGGFFNGYDQFHRATINNTDGTIWNAYNLIVGQGNVSTAGVLLTISFDAIGIGNTSVGLFGLGVCNETRYIVCSFTNGSITVIGSPNQENDTIPPTNDTVTPGNDTVPPVNDTITPPPADDIVPPEDNTKPPEDKTPVENPSSSKNPFQAFGILIVALAFAYAAMSILSRRR
jgi:hypothetical protein